MVKLQQNTLGNVTVAPIEGRLDIDGVTTIGNSLLHIGQETGVHFVVDFSNVNYMSSCGLPLLTKLRKAVQGAGGQLRLAAVQSLVREVLETSGAHRLFSIKGTVKEAISSLGQ